MIIDDRRESMFHLAKSRGQAMGTRNAVEWVTDTHLMPYNNYFNQTRDGTPNALLFINFSAFLNVRQR